MVKPKATGLKSLPKFSTLPVELQRRIIVIAYYRTEDRIRVDWALISHQIREWVEPLIYESIVLPHDFQDLDSRSRLRKYRETFQVKPKEFYAKHVKNIYTNDNTFELRFLTTCDNVNNLEIWSESKYLTPLLSTKQFPNLKTLCINLDLFPKSDIIFNLPIFKNLTQLEFITNEPQLRSWSSLQSLEKLERMRVEMLVKTQEIEEALDQAYAIASEAIKYFPPSLKYFVILIPVDLIYRIAQQEWESPEDKQRWKLFESIRKGTFDTRVVMGVCGNLDDYDEEEEYSEEAEENFQKYLELVAVITYPRYPRSCPYEDEEDTWEDVYKKVKARKRLGAARRK